MKEPSNENESDEVSDSMKLLDQLESDAMSLPELMRRFLDHPSEISEISDVELQKSLIATDVNEKRQNENLYEIKLEHLDGTHEIIEDGRDFFAVINNRVEKCR